LLGTVGSPTEPRRKSGISAARALAEIANIATANRTLRIEHSHPHFRTWRDHRSLTLINRFQARFIGKILSENGQPSPPSWGQAVSKITPRAKQNGARNIPRR
jgi:hypothetical protein